MVDPGRYSQRSTALTLSERVLKSGRYTANSAAGPAPSGSTPKQRSGPELPHTTLSAGVMVGPLSWRSRSKEEFRGACSSLEPREAPETVRGYEYCSQVCGGAELGV